MDEIIHFTATINRQAILTVRCKEEILSQKKIERDGQRSTFKFKGNSYTWICEIRKYMNRRGKLFLYFYPVNINYEQNPVEVEEEL